MHGSRWRKYLGSKLSIRQQPSGLEAAGRSGGSNLRLRDLPQLGRLQKGMHPSFWSSYIVFGSWSHATVAGCLRAASHAQSPARQRTEHAQRLGSRIPLASRSHDLRVFVIARRSARSTIGHVLGARNSTLFPAAGKLLPPLSYLAAL